MNSILVSRIVECVRNLNIRITDKNGRDAVKIVGGSEDFPERLMELQKALEEYDRSSGAGNEDRSEEDHKIALNALLTRLMGLLDDGRSPEAVLQETIRDYGGEKSASKGAAFELKPAKKKKGGFKEDHLRPLDNLQNRGSLQKMRSDAFMASGALSGLGKALVASDDFKKRSFERAQRDIQRRIDEQERMEDEADPGAPGHGRF